MTAGFIRYMAATSGGADSELACAFMKPMLRVLPVRLVSITGGGLSGGWIGYEALLATPMLGTFINVVCCDPSRWTWRASIEAPKDNSTPETVSGRIELWTAGVRNVLIAPCGPRSEAEIVTARKYDCIVAPSVEISAQLARANIRSWCIPHPGTAALVRSAVLYWQHTSEADTQ